MTDHDHDTCGECCHRYTQARIEAVNELLEQQAADERGDVLARHLERPYE